MNILLPKIKVLKRIIDKGIVAVIRAETSEEGEKIAKACMNGGIDIIEITFTVLGTHKVIENLKKIFGKEELIVGGSLTSEAKKGNYEKVADTAKKFIKEINKARGLLQAG